MRRCGTALAALFVLAFLATPFTTTADNSRWPSRDFFGRESVTCGAVASTLSSSIYAAPAHGPVAQYMRIRVEGESMRWSATGPVGYGDEQGEIAAVNDVIEIHGINNIRNFRCVDLLTPSAHLRVQYAR